MPTPSLLIVPARFKTGKLYSQIPTANGDFTVTRNTEARRFDSAGLVASVASGIPRLDYYTSGGVTGCPALLVEPAATNLCRYSEQFDTVTSGWSTAALQTITGNTNATLDPAGGNTADLIVATTASGTSHKIFTNTNNFPSFVSGTAYTFSVFAKATSVASGFVQIVMGGNTFSPGSPYANFQLSGNGAITTGTYSAASVQSFGNGWYRCSITATAAAASSDYVGVIGPILASGTTRDGNFAGNGVDGVYLWGAQLETGSVATSYIPTTAGTGSRSADVISVSGAVSGSIGQTEGTIYVEVDFRNLGYNGAIVTVQTDNWITNSIQIQKSLGNQWRFTIRAVNSEILNINIGTITAGIYKVALAYNTATSGTVLAVNGSILSTQTASSIPACNSVVLGARNETGTFTVHLNDRIRAAALYTTRLTNAELATLTTP